MAHDDISAQLILSDGTIVGPGNGLPISGGSFDLSSAVILAPGSSTRNVIQPTGDFVALEVKANAAQTNPLQQWKDTSAVAQARVLATGLFSSPGTGSFTEQFGALTIATGDSDVVIGYNSKVKGSNTVAIGESAFGGNNPTYNATKSVLIGSSSQTTADETVAIGWATLAESTGAVSIGSNNDVFGVGSIGIGHRCFTEADYSIAIGRLADAGYTSSIAIGSGAVTLAANQLVIGGVPGGAIPDFSITDVYIGKGITHATPAALKIQVTGASGANIAGVNLTLSAGKSTGSAKGGDLLFQTSPAGGAGSGLNTLSTILQLTGDSKIGVFGVTPVARTSAYTPTNVTTDRSYNANSTTLDEIADVLGTLIADLQGFGFLG